jgi:hypothetical protein
VQVPAITVSQGAEFESLLECRVDWEGEGIDPPISYGFLIRDEALHFRARRSASVVLDPDAVAGAFQEELWKYEVAEFFLSHPENGSYLEVNLSPHGAWWTCLFRAPRVPWSEENDPLPGVRTEAHCTESGWEATLSVPLASLQALPVGFGEGWGLNATFIVDSPVQRFLTACPLGPGEPDFHRPEAFAPLVLKVADGS